MESEISLVSFRVDLVPMRLCFVARGFKEVLGQQRLYCKDAGFDVG